MNNTVEKKIYYRIEFETSSAMSIGSGENQYSDKDILRDATGLPFIPGSSLAGIYKAFLSEKSEEDLKKYFGFVEPDSQGQSKIIVYDALLKDKEGNYSTSIRDEVGLDEWKTARKGCKFDFEVVEPGIKFVTYIEQTLEQGDENICLEIINEWLNCKIRLGSKTMRGFGSVDNVTVHKKEFSFQEERDLSNWLDFDMYEDKCWGNADLIVNKQEEKIRGNQITIDLELRQRSGISVRRYTTRVSTTENTQPDYEQMTYYQKEDETGKKEEVPFIPGTTWAGAFRHHMETLIPGCVGEYFGVCEKTEDGKSDIKKKSLVYFSDSKIKGAKSKIITRNAVNRFTGGVVEGALYTEKMWYGGKTELHIEIPKNADTDFIDALAAAFVDLHTGILSVGGLTAIGRGIFEIESLCINGENIKIHRDMYPQIVGKLKEEI